MSQVNTSFTTIISSGSHWANPFSYQEDDQYSLNTSQKVLVVALAILLFVPTFGVGTFLSIFVLTAAMKNRNIYVANYYRGLPEQDRIHYVFSRGIYPSWVDIRERPARVRTRGGAVHVYPEREIVGGRRQSGISHRVTEVRDRGVPSREVRDRPAVRTEAPVSGVFGREVPGGGRQAGLPSRGTEGGDRGVPTREARGGDARGVSHSGSGAGGRVQVGRRNI